jgi:hypothetical protein
LRFGRDDADVDGHRPGAADAVDDALLHGAKQLGLKPHVDLGNLVEQERAAVGFLELADTPRHGAGEGALLVAEQFGFEERFRNGRAIDADQRLPGAGRMGVQIARENLLAGAGFARDQHGGITGCDLLRQLDDARHGIVAVDQLTPVVGDRGEHRGDQFCVGRQWNVFLGAGMDGGDRGARIGGGTAGDDRRMDVLGLKPGDKIADVERDVDHQQVGAAAGAQHRQRLGDVGGVGDHRALVHCDLGRDGELAVQRSDDQEPHDLVPFSRLTRVPP